MKKIILTLILILSLHVLASDKLFTDFTSIKINSESTTESIVFSIDNTKSILDPNEMTLSSIFRVSDIKHDGNRKYYADLFEGVERHRVKITANVDFIENNDLNALEHHSGDCKINFKSRTFDFDKNVTGILKNTDSSYVFISNFKVSLKDLNIELDRKYKDRIADELYTKINITFMKK